MWFQLKEILKKGQNNSSSISEASQNKIPAEKYRFHTIMIYQRICKYRRLRTRRRRWCL